MFMHARRKNTLLRPWLKFISPADQLIIQRCRRRFCFSPKNALACGPVLLFFGGQRARDYQFLCEWPSIEAGAPSAKRKEVELTRHFLLLCVSRQFVLHFAFPRFHR
jgi:hypothetical protein